VGSSKEKNTFLTLKVTPCLLRGTVSYQKRDDACWEVQEGGLMTIPFRGTSLGRDFCRSLSLKQNGSGGERVTLNVFFSTAVKP